MSKLANTDQNQYWKSEDLLLVGSGSVSFALAESLVLSAEYEGEVGVWARNPVSLQRFEKLGVKTFTELSAGLSKAAAAIVCVSDGALEQVAAALANALDSVGEQGEAQQRPGQALVVLHTSGFRGTDALTALAPSGAALGVMHPMAAVAGRAGDGTPFTNVTFGVSGSTEARQCAGAMAALLGGQVVLVKDELRGLYHGAAALLSGGLVALFAEAEACLAESLAGEASDPGGEPRSGDHAQASARFILRGLLASTTSNLMELPPEQALTGPVARGDSDVVAGHAQAFAGRSNSRTGALHELLTKIMLELVHKRDRQEP
ncbi:MAG: putative short-subunit dehydrogenase-like oxidoreductase (DUF2520 family) [Planctomycetota bacterium]|jgi:predicted short-subunit dehydrogenase-like oxidoreductase (DUF2520 family)